MKAWNVYAHGYAEWFIVAFAHTADAARSEARAMLRDMGGAYAHAEISSVTEIPMTGAVLLGSAPIHEPRH